MRSAWRLLLDQNVRYEVKEVLRENGFDAVHASDLGLGKALDPEILQHAVQEQRTLVTHDADFGDLHIFPLPPHHFGVIRLKIDPPIPQPVADILIHFLNGHTTDHVADSLVVITERKVRFRRL